MKKYFLTFLVIVTFGAYAIYMHKDSDEVAIVPPTPSLPAPTPSTPSTSLGTSGSGQYKDGTYTGPVVDAFYGNIQVRTTITSGQISDVQFLQFPNDRGTSIQINSEAMPILKSEAIKAQNAQVNIVSGATDSSNAFRQSLQSTLTLAKA